MKILKSATSLFLLSGISAFAADLPSIKSSPVAAPTPIWTGFYAGLNAGYNFGENSNISSVNWRQDWQGLGFFSGYSSPAAAPYALDINKPNSQNGFIGGGQIGYNYQFNTNILVGIEADIQGASIRGTTNGSNAASRTASANGLLGFYEANQMAIGSTNVQTGVDYLGTLRGRLGYLAAPSLLIYGSGGFAYGGVQATVTQSATSVGQLSLNGSPILGPLQSLTLGNGNSSQLLTGWTAGGGLEWMFMPNWSLKAEALYWNLGSINVNTSEIGISPDPTSLANAIGGGNTSVNYSGITTRLGLNYQFNFSSTPVPAKF